jgi:GMP synthase (glutamine-hydrolysing)
VPSRVVNGENGPCHAAGKCRKVLIVVHQETSTPGRVGNALKARGFELDIRRPPLGHDLPETLEEHYGVCMFGGPMSANDEHDYVRREIDWINVPLKEDKPFLGICLGAQMLVRTLGGKVGPHPEEHVEIGYYPIRPTQAGRTLGDWPSHVYQWHREGFDLPACSTLLAQGEVFENQAFAVGGKAYGLQFHPELTLAMMHRWTVRGAHRFVLKGAQDRNQHFAARQMHDRPLHDWLHRFLDHWTALDPA